jgi:hypothetical protein
VLGYKDVVTAAAKWAWKRATTAKQRRPIGIDGLDEEGKALVRIRNISDVEPKIEYVDRNPNTKPARRKPT